MRSWNKKTDNVFRGGVYLQKEEVYKKWHEQDDKERRNPLSLRQNIPSFEPVQLGRYYDDNDVEKDADRILRQDREREAILKQLEEDRIENERIQTLVNSEKERRKNRDKNDIISEKEEYKKLTNQKIMIEFRNIIKNLFEYYKISNIPSELTIEEKPICFKIEKKTGMVISKEITEYYTLSKDVFKQESVCNDTNYNIKDNKVINTFIKKYGTETMNEKEIQEKVNDKNNIISKYSQDPKQFYKNKGPAIITALDKGTSDFINKIENNLDLKIPIKFYDTVKQEENKNFKDTIELSDTEKQEYIVFFKQNINTILNEEKEKLTKTLTNWDELKNKKKEFDMEQDIRILKALQKNNIFKNIKKETGSGGKRTSKKVKQITRRRRTARKTHRRKYRRTG